MITLIIREFGSITWTTGRLNGLEEFSQNTMLLYLFGIKHNRYGPARIYTDTAEWYINNRLIPTYLEYLIIVEQTKLQPNNIS